MFLRSQIMKAELVAEYLTALRLKNDLTFEAIAERSKRSVSTVKNLCTGKTEDPRLDTVAPIVYAMGGSIDEMYNPDKSKDEIKETSVLAMKDIYENQLHMANETHATEMERVRSHYEQHHYDLVENFKKVEEQYEKRLESEQKYSKKLEKSNHAKTIIIGLLAAIPIVLFILEILHPEHGWIRY